MSISTGPSGLDDVPRDYRPVPMVYELRYSILKRIRSGRDVLPEIQGREEAKRDVVRALLSGAHPYLVSEEGTGKTRLARSLTALLPPLLRVKGCPYNDDPRWSSSLLCPRCRDSRDPAARYGVEYLPPERRFSRIQGNEYTNEAKLLGLKDIQAIAQGRSPSDPAVFTGTGVFRANRGILFIDELPAIRTNVQVLLHPLLEEKRVILEEYNWQYPLDLVLVATGNPRGFSHVHEVPRPLLDRMELIYMDMPEEAEEREIMLKERFGLRQDGQEPAHHDTQDAVPVPDMEEQARRTVAVPWWIVDIVNRTVRHSRTCPRLERKASIRASTRAIDHTCAGIELDNAKVGNLKHAFEGLKLALRGRVGLGPEYMDLDEPRRYFDRIDVLVEDLLWNAVEDFEPAVLEGCDLELLGRELRSMPSVSEGTLRVREYDEVGRVVDRMVKAAGPRAEGVLLTETEKVLASGKDGVDEGTRQEYLRSALEVVVNLAVHRQVLQASEAGAFVPRKIADTRL